MGVISRAGDLVYTFRFLKLLVTPFEKTNAFKLGLIDDQGKKLRKPETTEEKSAYNPFHRIVFNIKKLIAKAPGGSTRIASYASALFLIQERDAALHHAPALQGFAPVPLRLCARALALAWIAGQRRLAPRQIHARRFA